MATLANAERLIGLGVHQETGRDIYLGGLYLNEGTQRPADLRSLAAPRIMEYRIVARRTSIRSLLGGMLLQSEIATGNQPSASTNEFADAVLSKIRSSLYAGDSLKIALTPEKQTVASLNGHQVAVIDAPEVANYLLAGWLNENGASTQFRSALIASKLDPKLLARLEETRASDERNALIAASLVLAANNSQAEAGKNNAEKEEAAQLQSSTENTQTASSDETAGNTPRSNSNPESNVSIDVFQPENTDSAFAPNPAEQSAQSKLTAEQLEKLPLAQTYPGTKPAETLAAAPAEPTVAPTVAPTAAPTAALPTEDAAKTADNSITGGQEAALPALNLEPQLSATAGNINTNTNAQLDATGPANLDGFGRVAAPNTSIALTSQDLGGLELDSEVLSLGVKEYSQRLSTFHNDLVAKVYREIKYPKRAVRRSLEGRLELDITLRKSGELVAVAVAQTSGHKLLDEAAVEAAEAAMAPGRLESLDVVAVAEFGTRDGRVVVPVPVNFQLTQ
ncbi:MAG: TonB family protein [Halioglobus sp.]